MQVGYLYQIQNLLLYWTTAFKEFQAEQKKEIKIWKIWKTTKWAQKIYIAHSKSYTKGMKYIDNAYIGQS